MQLSVRNFRRCDSFGHSFRIFIVVPIIIKLTQDLLFQLSGVKVSVPTAYF